jgi:hypothetical protein
MCEPHTRGSRAVLPEAPFAGEKPSTSVQALITFAWL